jgi:hypothetical protein
MSAIQAVMGYDVAYRVDVGMLGWLERQYDMGGEEEGEGDSRGMGTLEAASSIHSGDYTHFASPGSPTPTEQVCFSAV